MSLLAVLLLAVGVADLVRIGAAAARPVVAEWSPVAGGALAALLAALGLGFGLHSLWIAVVAGAVALAWVRVALWVLPAVGVVALLAGQHVSRGSPSLCEWYQSLEIAGLAGVPLDSSVLALAVVVFLVESANVVVRRVLSGAGEGVLAEENQLKGGRILGPLERIAIFALALSGNVAAISAVVAAKGILRFPEISRDQESGLKAEYVLVGSFVSWALALVFVPLF